ncbi:MAG: hypothetical protein LBC75_03525 [Fibromonadaceae bacterium]|jgi:hypothetical protein|nr:hypothetical protein [Fibromonadaceae bacterium]
MTGISMPEALIVCVTIICFTVFITPVVLKGMDYGLWTKKKELMNEKKE